MSLLGKILALFNIFGAIGLIVMASMDYGKRQAWSYKQLRHDLALSGLPLDAKEDRADSVPIADLLSEETLRSLFQQVGGSPVATQLQEVERVQGILNGKLQAVSANKRAQTYLTARILLPLADQHYEREQLLACRSLLAADAGLPAFKARYGVAFREAIKKGPPPPPGEIEKTFEEAFRAAVRAQPGEPSEAFTSMMLKELPNDREKAAAVDIDKVFDKTFEAQLAELGNRYNEHFNAALQGPVPASLVGKGTAMELQKTAIARLLFGLSLFLAEDTLETDKGKDAALLAGLPRTGAAFGQRLADTDTYRTLVKRVYVVCGLRAGLDAVSERAKMLAKLTDYLAATRADERQYFVGDLATMVERIKQMSALVKAEQVLKEESNRKLVLQTELVKKRERDVKQHQDELKESRAQTDDKMKELRGMSQKLLDKRVKARDDIRNMEQAEKLIRSLEKQIQELEKQR